MENVKTRNQEYELERANRKIRLLTEELDKLRDILLSKDEETGELEKRIQNLEDILKEAEKPIATSEHVEVNPKKTEKGDWWK